MPAFALELPTPPGRKEHRGKHNRDLRSKSLHLRIITYMNLPVLGDLRLTYDFPLRVYTTRFTPSLPVCVRDISGFFGCSPLLPEASATNSLA